MENGKIPQPFLHAVILERRTCFLKQSFESSTISLKVIVAYSYIYILHPEYIYNVYLQMMIYTVKICTEKLSEFDEDIKA